LTLSVEVCRSTAYVYGSAIDNGHHSNKAVRIEPVQQTIEAAVYAVRIDIQVFQHDDAGEPARRKVGASREIPVRGYQDGRQARGQGGDGFVIRTGIAGVHNTFDAVSVQPQSPDDILGNAVVGQHLHIVMVGGRMAPLESR